MGTIDTKTSKYIVKKNYITITLNKKEKKHWDQLVFKESSVNIKLNYTLTVNYFIILNFLFS